MTKKKIFILNSEWRDSKGKNELIFYGISADREPVEVVVDNVNPVFFVNRGTDLSFLQTPHKVKDVELKTFDGTEVSAVYFNMQRDLRNASDELRKRSFKIYEDDIQPDRRFLMERFINSQMEIEGEYYIQDKLYTFHNPNVQSCKVNPEFLVASVDIETGTNGSLYSIAVHLWDNERDEKYVFMRSKEDRKSENVEYFSSEEKVLRRFLNFIYLEDPDIIIGWHVIGFDLMFLENRCDKLRIPFKLGRGLQRPTLRQTQRGAYFAYIPGRAVIDGPFVLRSSFYNFEDFKLDTVAKEILGEGKLISPEENKVEKIEEYFRNDKEKLAEYNLIDTILVSEIFQKTGLINLSVTRAKLSGLLIENLSSMTAAFDHFYLPKIHRYGFVVSSLRDIIPQGHAAGGFVFEPTPGIYENVVVCDFKSLYPSIIRTFKIDPLSRLMADTNTISTPVDIKFSATEHILPDFIAELLESRTEAKRKNDNYLSQAIKILMNSFYGVMGSYSCRFYHKDLPTAITGTGKWILLTCEKFLNEKGYVVAYGDTDSLFIRLKEDEAEKPYESGDKLAIMLNEFLKNELKENFGVESYLEIEFEKFYRKFVSTSARAAEHGAKKRYAGLAQTKSREYIDFVGMEAVRSDWTKLAKEFQHELYDRIFKEKEIEKWLREYVLKIKNGDYDEKLIYSKRLRKDVHDYKKNIPPHVKAAKKINKRRGTVYYVITLRGPVPIELNYNDVDYNHYIEKQIKPIADSVLSLMNLSFDKIVNSTQLGLFE